MKQIFLVFAKSKKDGHEWHSFDLDKLYLTKELARAAIKGKPTPHSIRYIIKKFVVAENGR